jgi:ribosomal protein S19E (S16A)
MEDRAIWELIQKTWTALGTHYEPLLERFALESGLSGRGWGVLFAVLSFEPESTTPAHFLVRSPYTAVEHFHTQLQNLSEKGLLTEVSQGKFQFTPTGREWTNNLITEVRREMAKVDPLPKADSDRLSNLLLKLVENCLKSPSPPDTWSIRLSYKLMPEKDPPLPYIEQAITCLAAYRDDSHLAAWQQSGLSATSLESLTLIWRNQVRSLEDIINQLSHRGHPSQVYVDALKELSDNKLIDGSLNELRLSPNGQSFRDKVEEDTDSFFFAPWICLTQSDRQELDGLLNNLWAGLKPA